MTDVAKKPFPERAFIVGLTTMAMGLAVLFLMPSNGWPGASCCCSRSSTWRSSQSPRAALRRVRRPAAAQTPGAGGGVIARRPQRAHFGSVDRPPQT